MASIPTVYRGVRFRSRLKAKWAYIFDRLGWEWDYEPFDLDGWIPDFVISKYPSLEKALSPVDPRKPLVVDIKPVEYRGESESSAPRDVCLKLEKALDSPYFHKPYSIDAWDKWFEQLKYYPAIFGTHPSHGWVFLQSWGWHQIGIHSYISDWDPERDVFYRETSIGFWTPDWQNIWREATNAVQWKTPQ